MEHLIGIDIGTSSLKAVLLNERLEKVTLSEVVYAKLGHPTDITSLHADMLWQALLSALKELAYLSPGEIGSVSGIGISCMCPGLCLIGRDGSALSEILIYSDRRSKEQARMFSDSVGAERIFNITGNRVMAGATSVTSMLWIKENLRHAYYESVCFGHINTLLCAMMCGSWAIDPSNASYTGLYDTKNCSWSDELCHAAGIPLSRLPQLEESIQVCGRICNKEISRIGIALGTPVVIGGADTPCAALACGAYKSGHVCDSSGTTNVLSICSDTIDFSPYYLNRRHVLPGLWIYQGVMSNAGLSRDWAYRILYPDMYEPSSLESYARLDALAASSAPGANGVLFLPYLTGERSPIWDPDAKGVFFGLRACTTREDMLRAVYESTCYGLKYLIDCAPRPIGMDEQITSVGGGSRSSFGCTLKADITGRTFATTSMPNAAATGAAMLAGIGVGMYKNAAEAHSALNLNIIHTYSPGGKPEDRISYSCSFEKYKGLYPALKHLF